MKNVKLTAEFKEELAYITENFINEVETYAKENDVMIEDMTVQDYIRKVTFDNDEGSFGYEYIAPAASDEFVRQKGIDNESAFEKYNGMKWQRFFENEFIDFFVECSVYVGGIFLDKGYEV